MKRILICLLCLLLVIPAAAAEILLGETETDESSRIAALEAGSMDAYFSPCDENIYYLNANGNHFSVSVFGTSSPTRETE